MPPSRRSSSSLSGRFVVSGPYEDEHPVPSIGAGMSCAQTFATRHRRVEGELTYYVRDLAGICYARVTKRESGIIDTTAVAA